MNLKRGELMDAGNAYWLEPYGDQLTLQSAPVRRDGTIEWDAAVDVDFNTIDESEATYCRAIMAALVAGISR